MVDAGYKFVFVDVGAYGREGDAGIFHRSEFGKRLMGNPTLPYDRDGLDIPYDSRLPGTRISAPHVFLGDQAFPLLRHLMKPYRFKSSSKAEHIFNYRLSRARRVVENAFGILSTRWRVLENRIDLSVATVDDIVKACVALHNFLKSTDATDHPSPRYCPPSYVDNETVDGHFVPGEWRFNVDQSEGLRVWGCTGRPLSSQYGIRERLKQYFQSDIGSVPWQDDAVSRSG